MRYMAHLRRSATEAQLALEFGGVSKMEFEFEFEFLFRPGLKLTFEFEFDFELKSEFAFEVALEFELELASSIHLPAFLSSVKETTAICEKALAKLNFHMNLVRK